MFRVQIRALGTFFWSTLLLRDSTLSVLGHSVLLVVFSRLARACGQSDRHVNLVSIPQQGKRSFLAWFGLLQ
jgi:hypothetical protein